MKFNGTSYFAGMGDAKRFKKEHCLLKIGQIIELFFDDEDKPAFMTWQSMKKGRYVVKEIRPGLVNPKTELVYVLVRDRKGAKYEHALHFIGVDKAIIAGAIRILP